MVHISEAIKSDHEKMQSYYNAIVSSEDADEQTRIQKDLIWELTRHAVSEERVVYPKMEEFLPDGIAIVDKDRQERYMVSVPNCLIIEYSDIVNRLKNDLMPFRV